MTDEQTPLSTRFTAATTAKEVLAGHDLTGKTAVVTGGACGLGLEVTRVLAAAGASVIVATRNPDKATLALASIAHAKSAPLDLIDAVSISRFAQSVLESGIKLDMLICNAGIMACPLARDRRSYESQWATNHLGHFQLACLLWPALCKAGQARVVCLSSRAHSMAGVDLEDPNFERKPYDKFTAYAQSKSANALFAVGLDRRGKDHGVRGFSVHPGVIKTDLVRDLTDDELKSRFGISKSAPSGYAPPGKSVAEGGVFKTVEQGAATTVWCATSAQLDGLGGVYCEDVNIARVRSADEPGQTGVRPWAIDAQLAEKLWSVSQAASDCHVLP